jgi:leukotriene-A4 hydrolase
LLTACGVGNVVQDTPLVKSTYDAAVHVPAPLRALMSAVPLEGDAESGAGEEAGLTTWKFRQSVPIPSYLVALAVGDLQGKSIGPLTKVKSPLLTFTF